MMMMMMIHTIFPTSSFIPCHRLRQKTHNFPLLPTTTTSNHHVNAGLFLNCAHGNGEVISSKLIGSSNDSASGVVTKFYDGINSRDLALLENLIAHNCVYEDLIFAKPFVGRKAILEFFDKFISSISWDLRFAIDDISEEDASAVGVTWHLEWKGKSFPFSKGCSFYRLDVINGQRQIVYGRDCVEPAIKPGETALVAIRGVTWLLQKFPALADKL